jgi:UDP-N-acetylglucosamine acyltransferase
MAAIHPTAIVEDGARLGADVKVGAYCHIGPHVEIGDGGELHTHVVIAGRTKIGARAQIYPFASIGHPPQDLKYKGEPSTLSIGDDCLIREGVTMNPGTQGGGMKTVVGNSCTFLAYAHVGHDCMVGNNVILSNNVMLAGHVSIGDFVVMGGGSAVIQFHRVGAHAFIGGLTCVRGDLIPYGAATGDWARLDGLNLIGLKRRNFDREAVHALRQAYRLLFADEGTLVERVNDVAQQFANVAMVQEVVRFLRTAEDRAICLPREHGGAGGT